MLYYFFNFLKQKESTSSTSLFTCEVWLFFPLLLIYYYSIKDYTIYSAWDEYSLWGILIKEMNINHGLRSPGSSTVVIDYMRHYTLNCLLFSITVSTNF
ncbi:hypothetical protein A3306_02570 [Rickettsia bellii]|nr:hypothetical protein A3306_02570 [Rickettsia bellii]